MDDHDRHIVGGDGMVGKELVRALKRIDCEVRDGLQHGFFELSVSSETIKGGKRRLTIRSGKSYQFIIAEEELKAAS